MNQKNKNLEEKQKKMQVKKKYKNKRKKIKKHKKYSKKMICQKKIMKNNLNNLQKNIKRDAKVHTINGGVIKERKINIPKSN